MKVSRENCYMLVLVPRDRWSGDTRLALRFL